MHVAVKSPKAAPTSMMLLGLHPNAARWLSAPSTDARRPSTGALDAGGRGFFRRTSYPKCSKPTLMTRLIAMGSTLL
jgi:hypothetical protein